MPSNSASHIKFHRLPRRKMPPIAGDVTEQIASAFFDFEVRPHAPGHPASLLVVRALEDRFRNAQRFPGRPGERSYRNGRRPSQRSKDRYPWIVVRHFTRALAHLAACSSVTAPALRCPWWKLAQEVARMARSLAGWAYSCAFTTLAAHASPPMLEWVYGHGDARLGMALTQRD
jgi:hypothetical protein